MRRLLLGLALVGAACGNDDAQIDTGPAPEPSTSTSTTEAPTTTVAVTTTATTEAPVVLELEPEPTTVYRPTPTTRRATTTVTYFEPRAPQSNMGGDRESLLACIRSYEGDYGTNTGNGYYGAYQFDLQTWRSVGGSGLPSDASPAEQDARAWALYLSRGLAPWPTPAVMCR